MIYGLYEFNEMIVNMHYLHRVIKSPHSRLSLKINKYLIESINHKYVSVYLDLNIDGEETNTSSEARYERI